MPCNPLFFIPGRLIAFIPRGSALVLLGSEERRSLNGNKAERVISKISTLQSHVLASEIPSLVESYTRKGISGPQARIFGMAV